MSTWNTSPLLALESLIMTQASPGLTVQNTSRSIASESFTFPKGYIVAFSSRIIGFEVESLNNCGEFLK